MVNNLYFQDQVVSEIRIVSFKPPGKGSPKRVNTFGGTHIIPGKKIPGQVMFEVPSQVSYDDYYLGIDHQGVRYNLEVRSTEIFGSRKRVSGIIY